MVEKRQIYFFRETVVLQLIKNFPKTSWTSVQTKFVDGSMYNFRMLTYPKTFFALDKKKLRWDRTLISISWIVLYEI